jgi:hypothetical protein
MSENVTITYRGAGYELGRGPHYYGIWAAGTPRSQPLEWWPESPEGWNGAWSRFTGIEQPGTIVPVVQSARTGTAASTAAAGDSPGKRLTLVAGGLLALGVVAGIVGLFPQYDDGASLASQPALLWPHLIYFAAWAAGAVMLLLGGTRLPPGARQVGALLAAGTSLVTFGLYFGDLAEVITSSSRFLGVGLVLGLIGWLACAAGSGLAVFRLRPEPRAPGVPGAPTAVNPVLILVLTVIGAVGAAVTFIPSWDRYVVHVFTGSQAVVTEGYAFANPGLVIAGDVIVVIALVGVAIVAGLWRPHRLGGALLAGAIIPMAAQAISALIQLGEPTSPLQLGFSSAQVSLLRPTITNGVTPAFWIFCIFIFALIGTCAQMMVRPRR